MRRTLLPLTLALAVLAACQDATAPTTPATLAPRSRPSADLAVGEQLDQENLSANSGAGTGSIYFGQSFTAGVSGALTRIEFQINCQYNAQDMVLRVYEGSYDVYEVDFGYPPVVLKELASAPVAATTWPSCNTNPYVGPSWIGVALDTPATLVAGQQYMFRLTCAGCGTFQINHPMSNDDPYAGGKAFVWPTYDNVFRTYVVPDNTPPTVTPTITGTLGSNGWYTSDVTLAWSAADGESTVSAQTGCGPTTVRSDTPGVTFTCSATSGGGTATQSVTIRRDATAPAIAVTGVTQGATYTLGSVPAGGCATTDALSGVATNATVSTSGGPTGSVTTTCGGAVDNAGNAAASVSVGYTVLAPPPVLSIDANGTLDKRTGAAIITGTATCSSALSVTVSAGLSQQQTKGKTTTTLSGGGSTTIACSGTTAWMVTITPSSSATGRFAAGVASATASAPRATTASRTVQLK